MESEILNWRDGRRNRVTVASDKAIIATINQEIGELPTYDYRRPGILANMTRTLSGQWPLNHKCIYWLIKAYCLLLSKVQALFQQPIIQAQSDSIPVQYLLAPGWL